MICMIKRFLKKNQSLLLYTNLQKDKLGGRSIGALNFFTHKVGSHFRKDRSYKNMKFLIFLPTPASPKPIHKSMYLICSCKEDMPLLSSTGEKSHFKNLTLSITVSPFLYFFSLILNLNFPWCKPAITKIKLKTKMVLTIYLIFLILSPINLKKHIPLNPLQVDYPD